MTVTSASIKERFPEFGSVIDGDVVTIIAEATRRVNVAAWGSRADDGIMWLTAHLLLNLPLGSKASKGALTGKKVSKLDLRFASSATFANTVLGSTAFGREYMSLRSLVFADRRL